MQIAADTAAVMVTHDGEPYVRQQIDSIFAQTLLPAVLVVVDDASRDGTRGLLDDIARSAPIPMELIRVDSPAALDPKTRIAGNFITAMNAATGFDVLVLSDQDDLWLPDRLARQRQSLRDNPGALLVAGDGILIDAAGHETGGSLRDSFPIPGGWEAADAAARARIALRTPLVTGAAAAMTSELARLMQPVPRGWLHDRWATLVAVARGGLVLQREPVIRYRIHGGQVLGQRQARTGSGERRWRQVRRRGAGPLEAASRAAAVVNRVRPMAANSDVRREFSWRAVIASGLDRT
jgi:glycosyltransferase involved in cell wall biosynthesis